MTVAELRAKIREMERKPRQDARDQQVTPSEAPTPVATSPLQPTTQHSYTSRSTGESGSDSVRRTLFTDSTPHEERAAADARAADRAVQMACRSGPPASILRSAACAPRAQSAASNAESGSHAKTASGTAAQPGNQRHSEERPPARPPPAACEGCLGVGQRGPRAPAG